MQSKKIRTIVYFLALLTLGSMILAACGRSDGGSGNTPSNNNSGPTVHMDATKFLQDSITIPKGASLTLVDDVAVPHIIQNGTWNNGTQEPKQEPGAPKVDVQLNGSDTQQIGPFTTAGTFKLYCTIHPGMNLTVIVQ